MPSCGGECRPLAAHQDWYLITNENAPLRQTMEMTQLPPKNEAGPNYLTFLAANRPASGYTWGQRVLELRDRVCAA